MQQHLLQTDVNLAQARADQLPDLYERFMATTRDERRQWSYADWDAAGQVLARLNQRYEQVRTDLPLEERVRIRALSGRVSYPARRPQRERQAGLTRGLRPAGWPTAWPASAGPRSTFGKQP